MAFSGNDFSGFSGMTEDQIALVTRSYQWWEDNVPHEPLPYLSNVNYALSNIRYYNIARWLPFFNDIRGEIKEIIWLGQTNYQFDEAGYPAGGGFF